MYDEYVRAVGKKVRIQGKTSVTNANQPASSSSQPTVRPADVPGSSADDNDESGEEDRSSEEEEEEAYGGEDMEIEDMEIEEEEEEDELRDGPLMRKDDLCQVTDGQHKGCIVSLMERASFDEFVPAWKVIKFDLELTELLLATAQLAPTRFAIAVKYISVITYIEAAKVTIKGTAQHDRSANFLVRSQLDTRTSKPSALGQVALSHYTPMQGFEDS